MGQSFSAMRKQLEKENICDCLKGRIKYFVTLYRESDDGWEGRMSVSIDNKEVFKSNTHEWHRLSGELWHNGNRDYEKRNIGCHKEGVIDVCSFYQSFYFYQNHSIHDSLASDDALIRLFAILDKRVGKKTLKELQPALKTQPEWLQVFYRLRLEAEGILPTKKTNEC